MRNLGWDALEDHQLKKPWTDALNVRFLKGKDLCEQFYLEAVKPVMEKFFPDTCYSAALLGLGSDVLGYDTDMSMDHDWGPRVTLFLDEADSKIARRYCLDEDSIRRRRELALRDVEPTGYDALELRGLHSLGDDVDYVLRQELPHEFKGFPTSYSCHRDSSTRFMEKRDSGEVNHNVTIQTLRGFWLQYLNYDIDKQLKVVDWLTFPEQLLCGISSSRLFHDGLGRFKPVRDKLNYYPHEVWLYLLANQWQRLWSIELAILDRCSQVHNELGFRLMLARIIRNLMKLCFLMERKYAPFAKWFETAFAQLPCASDLTPLFIQILAASSRQEQHSNMLKAFEIVADMHNGLGITEPLPFQVTQFATRPFLVVAGEKFADAIRAKISDKEILSLPENTGSIDQFVSDDAVWVLGLPAQFNKLKSMYE
ncbi:DUF4037 domain-containing protein [Planctomycetota bacterium]